MTVFARAKGFIVMARIAFGITVHIGKAMMKMSENL